MYLWTAPEWSGSVVTKLAMKALVVTSTGGLEVDELAIQDGTPWPVESETKAPRSHSFGETHPLKKGTASWFSKTTRPLLV